MLLYSVMNVVEFLGKKIEEEEVKMVLRKCWLELRELLRNGLESEV